ncbi:unnamed protein product [Hydatigera taeniaeformis]|uniref:Usp domain-containing protein n=1 Tax=Hydatigena taeniaeformis TaxID=6205 RepID=A0A0R3X236_HYDTA|nr:unnamed protein product [Hydatigera taeniaeformis]
MPVDGSSNSHRAFNWFLKYDYRKSDFIIFLHVLQSKSSSSCNTVMALDNLVNIPVQSDSEPVSNGDAVLEKFRKLAEQAGVNFTVEALNDSSVAEAILRLASDLDANFIVVGSRGVSGVRRATLGSVSHYLVTHSSVPVLVVPSSSSSRSFTSA